MQPAKKQFAGKTAVVTGAGSGIGLEVARQLAKARARIVLIGRDAKKLAQARETVCAKTDAHCFSGDVGNAAFCARALQQTEALFGGADFLFNCAGIIRRATVAKTTTRQWRETMAANLDGVFYMSRAALPQMQKRGGGAIVNIASTVGIVGAAGLSAYCASKGGVVLFTRAMAVECAESGVTVNAVCPGATETPMLFSQRAAAETDEQTRAKNVAAIPAKRLATAEEAARAAIFLASEPHITGATLPIDGGYTAQ